MDWLQTKIFGNLTKVFSESWLLLLTPASYEIAKNHLSIPQLEVLPKLFSSKEFLLLFFHNHLLLAKGIISSLAFYGSDYIHILKCKPV